MITSRTVKAARPAPEVEQPVSVRDFVEKHPQYSWSAPELANECRETWRMTPNKGEPQLIINADELLRLCRSPEACLRAHNRIAQRGDAKIAALLAAVDP